MTSDKILIIIMIFIINIAFVLGQIKSKLDDLIDVSKKARCRNLF